MIEMSNHLEVAEWDSQFFGLRIGRLKANRLTPELILLIESWCQTNQIECLYFLADASDPVSSRLACKNQFQFVDARITFELELGPESSYSTSERSDIRRADRNDLPVLRELAGRMHKDSRFFFDTRFDAEKSGRMFQVWIEQNCTTPDCCVFLAEVDGRVAGYIACRRSEKHIGQVDLVAVDDFAQGKGLGNKLISNALRWLRSQGVRRVFVVTQERNVRAQRLYQRSGFVTHSVELWYHRWFGVNS